MTFKHSIICLLSLGTFAAAEPMPMDPLWQSVQFRKAFTASYGIDSRIEPRVNTEEKSVLEAMAGKMAVGKRTEAVELLKGNTLLNESAVMLFNLANLLFEQENREAAVLHFRKAIELYPNFRDAHRNLAVALVQGENIREAEPHLRRSLELGAQDGLTLGLLGYCHESAGRPQAALQAYRSAALTMPDEFQWRLGQGRVLIELGELGSAAALLEELLDKSPQQSAIWSHLADVRMQQGQPLLAIADLEVARRLGSLDSGTSLSLGHLFLNQSLYQRAMECYQEALTAKSPAPIARAIDAIDYLLRTRRWHDAGNLAQTLGSIAGYQEQLSGNSKASRRLERAKVFIEFHKENSEENARQIAAIVEKNPLDAHALLLLADFHLANKRQEHALMYLEQAATVKEYKVEALRKQGEILVQRGDYTKALTLLTEAQQLAPDENLSEYLTTLKKLAGTLDRE
ncbi:MAG: tetratricopeptide repeat protein [Verrucomicrobiales bacterium]|nr:tetratricopeptide repeat protein [Verrucomicrobiales bacterium]